MLTFFNHITAGMRLPTYHRYKERWVQLHVVILTHYVGNQSKTY